MVWRAPRLVSGTQSLGGVADSVLVLERDRTHRDATVCITGRDVDGVRFIFSGSADLKGNALFT